jgi:hypothetical protein
MIAADVIDLRVVLRQDEGRVPVEAVGPALGANAAALAGREVDASCSTVLALEVDLIRIIGVDTAVESVTAPYANPIFVQRTAVARAMRGSHAAVVLKTAVDLVAARGIEIDVIELADRELVVVVPRVAAVERFVKPAVTADEDVTPVTRVDPHRVSVGMNVLAAVRREGRAAILRPMHRNAEHPLMGVVVRIDLVAGEVHRTRVQRIDARPRHALVLRAVEAAVFVAVERLLTHHVGLLATEIGTEGRIGLVRSLPGRSGVEGRDAGL